MPFFLGHHKRVFLTFSDVARDVDNRQGMAFLRDARRTRLWTDYRCQITSQAFVNVNYKIFSNAGQVIKIFGSFRLFRSFSSVWILFIFSRAEYVQINQIHWLNFSIYTSSLITMNERTCKHSLFFRNKKHFLCNFVLVWTVHVFVK